MNRQRIRDAAVLDAELPEWRTLLYYPARFVEAWCALTGQTERTAWRWLAKARRCV